ncbi:hypothetical protein KKI24_08840 [bacterium]|nr:hypothetical protein [bacterium]
MSDIDLLMLGVNGDIRNDRLYHQLGTRTFKGRNRVGYKHLCGEYSTST